jgi:hypothetical protein
MAAWVSGDSDIGKKANNTSTCICK